jgi:adenosylhomocysteine nucleosidase
VKPLARQKSLVVVTGASFEARLASGPGISVLCSGGDPRQLQSLLDALDPAGVGAVISFGLAGGLDPALPAGSLIVASQVTSQARIWHASLTLAGALASALQAIGTRLERLAGVDEPVMDPSAKAALRAATGAAAVDMETHIAAGFAEASKLPWAALRVICDPATRGLPPLARQALKPGGGIDYLAVLKCLAADPGQIPALIAVARDTAIAMSALRRARRLLGPRFGLLPANLG